MNGSVNGSMNGPAHGSGRSSSVACIGAFGHEGSFVLVSDGGVASLAHATYQAVAYQELLFLWVQ
jgi:hypothetical protein